MKSNYGFNSGNCCSVYMSRVITIGLADHQLYFRRGVISALAKEKNIRVLWEASAVHDLVQLLHRSCPDILLVGMALRGFEFHSFFEQKKIRYPALQVIILTSSDDLLQAKELLDAGVNAILPRESEQDTVAAAITAVAENDIYFNELVSRALLTRLRRKNLGAPVDALQFSKNEIRVLELLADGYKTQEIANRIFLSLKSVENIRYQLKIKTGVSSSISLVAYALRHRLIR